MGKVIKSYIINNSLMTSSEIIRLFLFVNQFCINYLLRYIADIVHLTHPQHLIVGFESFGHAFFFSVLFY